MNLRRADARFLLPGRVRTAVVVGPLAGWREALVASGIDLRPPADGADLAVAAATDAARAFETGAELVILEGRGGRGRLADAGFAVTTYLPRPRRESPEFFLPLDAAAPAAYALRHWTTEDRRWRAARNALLTGAAARGRLPEVVPGVHVGARSSRVPYLVAAARECGADLADAGWLLSLGRADPLSRNVFHLFAASDVDPRLVLKFGRTVGYEEPFARDERGLRLAAAAGPVVAAHAPRLVARFDVEGTYASLETAAAGEALKRLLSRPTARETKLAALSAVAEWIVEVGSATSHPGGGAAGRLAAGARGVLDPSVADDVVAAADDLPAVLAHDDLGSWNVIRGTDGGFVAVDWESARPDGFPLWDLVYFLTEALATADAAVDGGWDDYVRALFRGELRSSPFLFNWIARAVAELELPADRIGPLLTLCWLHHSRSHVRRGDAVERHHAGIPTTVPPLERVAALWLADSQLGPRWSRWQTIT